MSRATGRTRPKKLAPRQNIQIVREDQVDSVVDFDSGRGPIETGVEKAEEAVSYPLIPFSSSSHATLFACHSRLSRKLLALFSSPRNA